MDARTGIAVFVYNRVQHAQQVLEGLRVNKYEQLYIFSDGPKSDVDKKAVENVRDMVSKVNLPNCEVIFQEKNMGLDNSIRFGINYVLKRHERIIVLEDDCVPMPSFMNYMNSAFDFYEHSPLVMSINACSPPFRVPRSIRHDAYFVGRVSSWGWGTWRDRWKYYDDDKLLYKRILADPSLRSKIDAVGLDLVNMLKVNYEGKDDNWDIFWATTVIQHDGVCLTPVKSHIKLIGLDGSGIHSGATNFYESYVLCCDNMDNFIFPESIEVVPEIAQRMIWMSYGRKNGIAGYVVCLFGKAAKKILKAICKCVFGKSRR